MLRSTVMLHHLRRLATLALVLLAFATVIPDAAAAPSFGQPIVRHQPDGSAITLYLWGDEFGLIAETGDGFTVVRDADGSWCYAQRSADGTRLESTGMRVGAINPRALGLADHVRADAHAVQAQRKERQRAAGLRVDGPGWGHWARRSAAEAETATSRPAGQFDPPRRTTTGAYKGLCLLIDFSGQTGTISRAEIDNAMNLSGYTGMGNSGSVRDYFNRVSGGRVDYTNELPATTVWTTGYYRAQKTFDQYNSMEDGARTMVLEALTDLKAKDPSIFRRLSYDSTNTAFALNVLYAGLRPDDWGAELWPHAWSLAVPFDVGNGQYVRYYQMSDMPSPLPLGTICHENGHLLCNFPDLYNYESVNQITPVASWCLMGTGGYGGPGFDGTAPTGVCGYLRHKAGWTDTVELTSSARGSMQTARAIDGSAAGGNVFLIRNSATEYFLIENRNNAGVDTYLPGPGLAIYHVDERGDNAYRTESITGQWECALVQADGSTSFLTDGGSWGNARAVFSNYGQARFSYQTKPTALWYNAKPTSLVVENISAPGGSMTFAVETGPGWIENISTEDSDDSSHCGSGGGFSFLGALLAAAFLTLRLRSGQRDRR